MLINISKLFLRQLGNKGASKKLRNILFTKIVEFHNFDSKEIRFDKITKDKILEKEAKTRDYFCDSQDLND